MKCFVWQADTLFGFLDCILDIEVWSSTQMMGIFYL